MDRGMFVAILAWLILCAVVTALRPVECLPPGPKFQCKEKQRWGSR